MNTETEQSDGIDRNSDTVQGSGVQHRGSAAEYMHALLNSRFRSQITFHTVLPPREAEYGECRRPWPKAIRSALEERGISRLFSHQAHAADIIRSGRSVVAATPTASGKSLIYNLPVLENLLADPDAHALYLFPLKALAQDQLAAFEALAAGWPADARPGIAVYDGDTSDYKRRKIRQNPPSVLITNPEMLHLAMLPHHEQWAPFFAGLTHIVVDEAHTYRGVFGAHMAQVFRRLNRITGRYGVTPTYVLCTATVGNPGEMASALLGSEMPTPSVITESGAPQGARHFAFINPDDSPATMAQHLLKSALVRGLRTIVYCKSRRMTELIAMWASNSAGPYSSRISAYRAGFLPEERRDIEARMASGELLAVVSTSALELGIDIGALDLCILVGYPGTVMSTLQRGGRVGRARQESAVLLVAGEDALDQYIVRSAEEFFTRPPENAIINPDNEVILRRHLECAAAEMPLSASEPWLARPAVQACLKELMRSGEVLRSADGSQYLAGRKRPQRHVDLRGSGESFTIEDSEGSIIGVVDGFRAYTETHPGAVYLHRGVSHVVTELDPARKLVRVQKQRVSWFTRVRSRKSTEILSVDGSAQAGRGCVFRGRLRITETVSGYEKRSSSGNRLLGIEPLDVPPHVFESEGIWFVIPDPLRRAMEDAFLHFMGAIHACEHAAIGILPLLVMADRNDFGGISIPLHPQIGLPAVFIYDALPGGAGLTRAAFGMARRLLEATLDTIRRCPCSDGCPSCVHSPKCGSGNRPISKEGACILLESMLGEGPQLSAEEVLGEIRSCMQTEGADAQARTGGGDFSNISVSAGEAEPASPPPRYTVLDVETRRSAAEVGGWHRADLMGVSVAVLYDSADDAYHVYSQEELPDMYARMAACDAVIGYNTLRFDYKVLEPFCGREIHSLPSVDLLARISDRLSYRVSLDNVGQATLGEPKSADGLQALKWWKEGRLDEIAAYCRKDVELTRRVYLYGLEKGEVLFTNKAGQKVRVGVDFALH